MCTKNELNIILSKIYNAYQEVYGKQIIKIILYGSYARKDFTCDSDIDIVAIVDGERENLQNELRKIWDVSSELEIEYETIVSPTVIPYKEYTQYKNILPYYRNIEKEGVEIVVSARDANE